MLATFIIGLREGLEAALIVSIVATFLKRNGQPLRPMWIGVGAAVALSILVGVVLSVIESSLPQAAQEGMESIINAIAVVLVTTMILWMAKHARGMKRELETAASTALASGTSRALVLMAFLAVLKEGFETSVFLLATFSAASSTWFAAAGAVLGIAAAVVLGYGLYTGGVKLNLAKFFKYTSVFLVLVAAGLLVSALRTAHEAGWLNAGQQRTLDLAWLAPTGSVRGAVLTGVLGIPADPRLVELLAWLAYVVPMLLIIFWPQAYRPGAAASRRIKAAAAAGCALVAAALMIGVRTPSVSLPASAPIVGSSGSRLGTAELLGTTVRMVIDGHPSEVTVMDAGTTVHNGVTAKVLRSDATPSDIKRTASLSELALLNGGRLPVGVVAERNPGPFALTESLRGQVTAYAVDGRLIDATDDRRVVDTISGGGLDTVRTFTLPGNTWTVDPAYVASTASTLGDYTSAQAEHRFWRWVVPGVLLLAAAALLAAAWRSRRAEAVVPSQSPVGVPISTP
ncbi:high-affinity iron transporter [Branchiibius hedensis]|uniref:High-affinity iron transporter n=1 Tax=Branchiibius hedensis TaxID=672460 RepID=A0A2Y8ZU75_9MICO|nr:iron uptake transporter permease EfeU [Branchiibius hedensis]PWJ24580.1 high-affinity iron transporter [Branchiibius hedensis]SSA33397.1 high-affinity iron transporter [Branchiibius hedensis]